MATSLAGVKKTGRAAVSSLTTLRRLKLSLTARTDIGEVVSPHSGETRVLSKLSSIAEVSTCLTELRTYAVRLLPSPETNPWKLGAVNSTSFPEVGWKPSGSAGCPLQQFPPTHSSLIELQTLTPKKNYNHTTPSVRARFHSSDLTESVSGS